MKVIVFSLSLFVIFTACNSYEDRVYKLDVLNEKLARVESENIQLENEVDRYKNKVESVRGQIKKAEDELDIIKTIAAQSETLEVFQNMNQHSVNFLKKYPGELPEKLNYVFVKSNKANIRKGPTTLSEVISNSYYFDKLQLLEEVKNTQGSVWYKVIDKNGKEGYIHSGIAEKREFRFNLMLDKLHVMDEFIEGELENGRVVLSTNTYIPDPNNVNLKRHEDRYGNVADQSAAGYRGDELIYIPDRTIVSIPNKSTEKDQQGDRIGIKTPYTGDSPILVKRRVIAESPQINKIMNKAIVIDTQNQNFVVFERIDEVWTIISYAYSKTGSESRIGFRTPKGFFIVPNAKKIMLYNSEIGKKQGYAKYAIRFSGGGYIHATPFNYDEDEEKTRYWKESSLGTYAGSRKCVRNVEEHAKFLFDWVLNGRVGKGNFQSVYENIAVIVI